MPKPTAAAAPIAPPAPTAPASPAPAPAAAPAPGPSPYDTLADAARAMLKLLPRDLATAPWPSPAQHTAYVEARKNVERIVGGV